MFRDGHRHEINLHPRGAHAHLLEALPPPAEPLEINALLVLTHMNLDHNLPNRQHGVAGAPPRAGEVIHHRVEGHVLGALDVDLQNVHVRVIVLRHEGLQREEGGRPRGVVCLPDAHFLEERPRLVRRCDLLPPRVDAEVVPPDARAGDAREHLRLERRLPVDAEAVDDDALLAPRGDALRPRRRRGDGLVDAHAADPFAAVAEAPDALHVVRARPGWGKEVPEGVGVLAEGLEGLGGEQGDLGVVRVGLGHLGAELDALLPGGFGERHAVSEGGEFAGCAGALGEEGRRDVGLVGGIVVEDCEEEDEDDDGGDAAS